TIEGIVGSWLGFDEGCPGFRGSCRWSAPARGRGCLKRAGWPRVVYGIPAGNETGSGSTRGRCGGHAVGVGGDGRPGRHGAHDAWAGVIAAHIGGLSEVVGEPGLRFTP